MIRATGGDYTVRAKRSDVTQPLTPRFCPATEVCNGGEGRPWTLDEWRRIEATRPLPGSTDYEAEAPA